ncbi:hypothetical protein ACS0TY_012904 [Phlomoides rotata]
MLPSIQILASGISFYRRSSAISVPQVSALWRLCVVTIIWMIWGHRNIWTFEDKAASAQSTLVAFWSHIRDAGAGITAPMRNTVEDLAVLVACGVPGRAPKAPSIIRVRCQPPPLHMMKVNIDGGAAGSPGALTCGGVFRDHFGVFRGCFAVAHWRGFAFEAVLAAALYAIELAHDRGWNKFWLESDSKYVVNFLKSDEPDVPWGLMARWHRVRLLKSAMSLVVSHIYREGNAVADRLTREKTLLVVVA